MIQEVYFVNRRKESVTFEGDWEMKLPHAAPPGYKEYLEAFGYGEYCDFLTVHNPESIAEITAKERESISTMLGYIRDISGLPDVDLMNLMPIAYSNDGDQVVTAASQPDLLIGVPRQDFALYYLADGFRDLLNWKRYGESRGEYVYRPPFRYFQSYLGRASVSFFTKEGHILQDVTAMIETELNNQETRRVESDYCVLLFARAIDGRVQIYQGPGDPRVGIQFSFDEDFRDVLLPIEEKLLAMGFYETSRT